MFAPYLSILVTLVFSIILASILLILARWVGWRSSNSVKSLPFECGNLPSGEAQKVQFSVKFYMTALLFLIFDMETLFVLLWAAAFQRLMELGLGALVFWEMMFFIGVLIAGYIYVWRRGGFEWN
ncbi:NADH-quinone oxidoreductase subunit A [Candidatus Sumerlaeota bacterium]|nr:NADH-quinone oxidoreductase subunit A [Candidatus Sumerlaeota bacterium]